MVLACAGAVGANHLLDGRWRVSGTSNGEVHWLDTGTGLVEPVAQSREHFEELVRSSPDLVEEWFLPPLVELLHAAGKKPDDGECYGFTILPVFAEGKYDTDKMFVVPVEEQLVGMAELHRQLNGFPKGSPVQVKVTDKVSRPCGSFPPKCDVGQASAFDHSTHCADALVARMAHMAMILGWGAMPFTLESLLYHRSNLQRALADAKQREKFKHLSKRELDQTIEALERGLAHVIAGLADHERN